MIPSRSFLMSVMPPAQSELLAEGVQGRGGWHQHLVLSSCPHWSLWRRLRGSFYSKTPVPSLSWFPGLWGGHYLCLPGAVSGCGWAFCGSHPSESSDFLAAGMTWDLLQFV